MNLPIFLGRKLSLRSNNGKSASAVKVAIIAVALSIIVMLASVAVMEGFKRDIRHKVVGFNSHLTIYADHDENNGENQQLVSLTPSLRKILDETQFITGYNLELTAPAIFRTDVDFKGVYVKGYDNNSDDSFISDNITDGNGLTYNSSSDSCIVISKKAADQLNLKVGDRIETYFISDNLKVRKMKISGIFNSHFDAYDDAFAFASKPLIDDVTSIKADKGTAIRVYTDDFNNLDEYATYLNKRLSAAYERGEVYRPYKIESVYRQGANYFQWLSLLDTNVVVILILMTIVSCVTLISGMLIIILDKIPFIGLMKSLGASNTLIRRIFVYLAIKVALKGIIIGNIIAIPLLWIQYKWRIIPLDPDSYYFDYVPINLYWSAFAIVNSGVLLVIFMALLLPSHFVSTIRPSTTLRYE